MPVIDVADAIRARLGAPTVDALGARLGADGTCPACRRRFGASRLSLCAYTDEPGHVTLVAYHAGCRATAWLESPGLDRGPTWRAAMTTCWTSIPASRPGDAAPHGASRRRRARETADEPARHGLLRRRRRHGARRLQVPLLVVHPRMEAARDRIVGPGESVNADAEEYHRLGFTDAADLAAGPMAPVGAARLMTAGEPSANVVVRAGFDTWAAPVPSPNPSLLTLIRARRGVLIGVGCASDPKMLAACPAALATAIDYGDLLLGWAPLSPA